MDRYQFQSLEAPCGIPVHVNRLSWVEEWFFLSILFHGGSWYDPVEKEGLAHYREHIGSRGTKKIPTFAELMVLWDEIFAATFQAYTCYEGLNFGGAIFQDRKFRAIDILREFIFFPRLEQVGVDIEREVLYSELRAKFKNRPTEDLHRRRSKDIWGPDHRLTRILTYGGTWDGLKNITSEDLANFGSMFLHKGNIEMVFCGDITRELAFELAAQFTDGIPTKARAERPPRLIESWRAPEPAERREKAQEIFGTKLPLNYQSSIIATRPLPHNDNCGAAFYILAHMLREILLEIGRVRYGHTYSPGLETSVGWSNRVLGFHLDVHPEHLELILKVVRDALSKFSGNAYRDLFQRKQKLIRDRNLIRSYDPGEIIKHALYNIFYYEPDKFPSLQDMIKDAESATYEQVQQIMLEEFPHAHWTIIEP